MTRFTAIPVVLWAAVGVSEAQAQRPEGAEGALRGGRIASGREVSGAMGAIVGPQGCLPAARGVRHRPARAIEWWLTAH